MGEGAYDRLHAGGSITAAGAYIAGATGKTVDVVHVVDSLGNFVSVSVSVGGGLGINPTSPSTPPKGAIAFTAVGGSGGIVWSLITNASGATLDATTGAYVAGAAGNVTDVIGVKDSNGNTDTNSIAVGSGIVVSPATAAVNTGFALVFAVQGGSGAGYVWALTTDASGGTLNATTGAYVAGNTAGSDLLRVTDSLGNTGGATITVKASVVPTGDGGVDSGTDSGVADAAVNDAAPERDAASGADSGLTLDAGVRDAAADGGSGSSPSKSCGCTVIDGSASNVGGGLGALLGLALMVRRRRRAVR